MNPQEVFGTCGLCASQGSTRFTTKHLGKDLVYKMKRDDGGFEVVTWVTQKIDQQSL